MPLRAEFHLFVVLASGEWSRASHVLLMGNPEAEHQSGIRSYLSTAGTALLTKAHGALGTGGDRW